MCFIISCFTATVLAKLSLYHYGVYEFVTGKTRSGFARVRHSYPGGFYYDGFVKCATKYGPTIRTAVKYFNLE
jgi:hypothetical protein